ncbi:MAG: hypothetical protein ACJAYU_005171 [Bradymonadia bacterium]
MPDAAFVPISEPATPDSRVEPDTEAPLPAHYALTEYLGDRIVPADTRRDAAECDAGVVPACRRFATLLLYGSGGVEQDQGRACQILMGLCLNEDDAQSCAMGASCAAE